MMEWWESGGERSLVIGHQTYGARQIIFERKKLTQDQRQVLDAIKVILNTFQAKQAKGLAFTSDDEALLGALEIIIDYMVKDSSIT